MGASASTNLNKPRHVGILPLAAIEVHSRSSRKAIARGRDARRVLARERSSEWGDGVLAFRVPGRLEFDSAGAAAACYRRCSAAPGGAVPVTRAQAGPVAVLAAVRPGAGLSLGVLPVMAFVNGWRSVIAGGLGMDSAPDDKAAVKSMRASANQFGDLLGAALGGLAP